MSKENTGEKETKRSDIKNENGKNRPQPEDAAAESVTEDQQDTQQVEEDEVEKEDIKAEEIDPVEKLQDELSETKDKFLRLYSEYDNFRRRTAKEKLEMMQTAGEDLVQSLLPVLDDFERAENSYSDQTDVKTIIEGMRLISQKFQNILQQKGLKKMDTKAGTEFDAELHEAITQIPAPKAKLKGKIVETVENGYYLGDKVIRHARVVIGN